jgi:hypothetical protein
VRLGVSPEAFGAPRPEFNGLRIKVPGQPEIYLVEEGYRRWIPNPTTYNNLIRDWNGIREDAGVADIPRGVDIAPGAVLAKGSTAPSYFVDTLVKRWITSPSTMDKYYFNWNRIVVVPDILLQNIPSGYSIS